MKKFLLIMSLMVLLTSQAFAACDYTTMCAPKAYGTATRGGQIVSKITGATFLSEQLAELIIGRELKKATKEKFKVDMKAYSAKDLAQGRFKSLTITGKNLEIEGAYITSFAAKTLCDFNYVEIGKESIKFKENLVMGYSVEISDTDLRKTVQSAGYIDKLNKINLCAMGITFFKLSSADVQVKNNKLNFTIKVTTPFSAKPIPILVRSDLKVENGNIVMTKVDLANVYTVIDLSRVTYLLNALNPLTFSMDVLNNKESKMNIQSVDIIGDRILVNGTVFVPKNTKK